MLLIFLAFAVLAIQPHFWGNPGVSIRSVQHNSSAANAGIDNPSAKLTPLAKEKIVALNGEKVDLPSDYYRLLAELPENKTVTLTTSKNTYSLLPAKNYQGEIDIGLKVSETAVSNLRKGLDLEGGTRVLLKPSEEISSQDFDSTIASLKERLNVYGLSDVTVRAASDLSGKDFILVEIAGVTEEEVKELLAKQGKFEAKIANQTVFFGGKKDITYVCRSAECSGINPRQPCGQLSGGGYSCGFFFSISLSPEAAQRHASITAPLTVETEGSNQYLSQDLLLFLDDVEVDRLKIGAELKGRATTDIQISGSGAGRSRQEAMDNALQNMKKLQTVIITGSLPTKLEVVKFDTISPSLGREFLSNVILVGVLAITAVIVVIFLRYHRAKILIPMALTLISEIILILGFAAFVGWNLDLASIAGIIVAAGTGVDHLVIITDETTKGEVITDWKQRIKNAMAIVIGAYLTTLSGMLPLLWAGAGLLKGFALTTIAGLSFGVLIARPAYAAIVEELLKEE